MLLSVNVLSKILPTFIIVDEIDMEVPHLVDAIHP